jgi:hypothetical protein
MYRVATALGVLVLATGTAIAANEENSPPNFLGPWQTENNFLLMPAATGPKPVSSLAGHVHVRRGVDPVTGKDTSGTGYVGDYTNPLLTKWAADKMKPESELAIKGTDPFWAASDCWPFGPNAVLQPQPVIFVRQPNKITIVYERDHQFRQVYMNVPHSKTPKPSWYGESVGHFEGDTLVIDTIGFNGKSRIDRYGTPYSRQLHMIERYHMTPDGKQLIGNITYDDPKAFTSQWSAVVKYRKARALPQEQACAEETVDQFTGKPVPLPIAKKADF